MVSAKPVGGNPVLLDAAMNVIGKWKFEPAPDQSTVIVEMTHAPDADPKAGAWQCPNCRHLYRFTHWKIQKGGKRALTN